MYLLLIIYAVLLAGASYVEIPANQSTMDSDFVMIAALGFVVLGASVGAHTGAHTECDEGKPESGWVYTHWGRSDCNEGSDLVYSGIAAGSRHRDLHGGGANILCVPHDPEFVYPVAGVGGARAFLYSVEYQISQFPLLQPHNGFDVSCAVCKANGRYSHVMVPGKNSCPSKAWTREYQGYLMAERSLQVHHKSMFICVDRDPVPIPGSGGTASANSARLDLVEPKCSTNNGGLPCDTFTTGYEFTCAVCTL